MVKLLFHKITLAAVLLLLGGLAVPVEAATKKAPSKSSSSKSSAKKPVAKKPAAKTPSAKTPEPPAEPPEPPPPLAPGELPLVARAAISLDLKTGNVLYEKNADALEYPASATKILTALLIIEAGKLDQQVTVQLEDTKVEPSALEIKPDETYTRKDLLYALLLKSANDVAMCLARDHSGSVAAFAEKMNQRAAELGAKETHFTNPHGLHNPHHFTTARDLATIARAAMQNPVFREIVATPEAMLQKAGVPVKLRNHNKLLTMLAGCTGVKTGYTVPAQQVLVSSAVREDREVLSVVLHTNKPGIWEDSKLLLNDGFVKLGVVPPAPPPSPDPAVPPGNPPQIPPPAAPGSPGAPKPPQPATAPAPEAPGAPGAKKIAAEPTTTIVPAR
jgi:D-alanyl-D-alanine carboxypeptidase (penicillin-binding protein 5/6)